jgi:hypothetical protein
LSRRFSLRSPQLCSPSLRFRVTKSPRSTFATSSTKNLTFFSHSANYFTRLHSIKPTFSTSNIQHSSKTRKLMLGFYENSNIPDCISLESESALILKDLLLNSQSLQVLNSTFLLIAPILQFLQISILGDQYPQSLRLQSFHSRTTRKNSLQILKHHTQS